MTHYCVKHHNLVVIMISNLLVRIFKPTEMFAEAIRVPEVCVNPITGGSVHYNRISLLVELGEQAHIVRVSSFLQS